MAAIFVFLLALRAELEPGSKSCKERRGDALNDNLEKEICVGGGKCGILGNICNHGTSQMLALSLVSFIHNAQNTKRMPRGVLHIRGFCFQDVTLYLV